MKVTISAKTGEQRIAELSDAESAEIEAVRDTAAAERAAEVVAEENLERVPKTILALALVIADLHGLTPAELRDLVRAKRRTLPGDD